MSNETLKSTMGGAEDFIVTAEEVRRLHEIEFATKRAIHALRDTNPGVLEYINSSAPEFLAEMIRLVGMIGQVEIPSESDLAWAIEKIKKG